MSMEYKVAREIAWDKERNNGRIFKGVMGVVLRHQPPESKWTREEYEEISGLLGNNAEARIVEWRDRAIEAAALLPEDMRRRLSWQGSDSVTDLSDFRAAKQAQIPVE